MNAPAPAGFGAVPGSVPDLGAEETRRAMTPFSGLAI